MIRSHLALLVLCLLLSLTCVHASSGRHTLRTRHHHSRVLHAPARDDAAMSVDITLTPPAYTISVHGQVWLQSSVFAVTIDGTVYSSAPQSGSSQQLLTLVSAQRVSGSRAPLGAYTGAQWRWSTGGAVVYETAMFVFDESAAVIFQQHFPSQLKPKSPTSSYDDVSSAFPSFEHTAQPGAPALNYLTFGGTFFMPALGHWNKSASIAAGQHGGVPFVLFGQKQDALVISPLSNFFVGYQVVSQVLGGSVYGCGLAAQVGLIPQNFTHETILFYGAGVGSAMMGWGDVLLYGDGSNPKPRPSLTVDPIAANLGYWTDNGAYYYYHQESGKNYEQTMKDAYSYLTEQLPIQYMQFDSWWYSKASGGNGVTLWEPQASVFPDGMSRWLGSDVPLILHNRYFDAANQYITSGNFTGSFVVEPGVTAYSMPVKQDVFDYMFAKAADWGMAVYEQDWLDYVYNFLTTPRTNVTAGAMWLDAMDAAARKQDLHIQMCMALPVHLLHSTRMHAVSQIRASNDYQLGGSQWQIGLPSLLVWAVGALPFKDDFFSGSSVETGCPYRVCYEASARLQTISSLLSAGPVGPSDGIGYADVPLLMETCQADGALLKPDQPLVIMDRALTLQFARAALVDLYTTYSEIPGVGRIHYVLTASITFSAQLLLTDLLDDSLADSYLAYTHNSRVTPTADALQLLTAAQPLPLRLQAPIKTVNGSQLVDFDLWVVSPVLSNGFVLLGDPTKIAAAAALRFESVELTADAIVVHVRGVPDESVTVAVADTMADNMVLASTCALPSGGATVVTCSRGAAACSCGGGRRVRKH